MMKRYRVGIVDDHKLFAEGISNIIKTLDYYDLSFIVTNAKDLFYQLETKEVDFLMLDVNLPDENGLEILKKLKSNFPSIKTMLLTMYQPNDINVNIKNFEGNAYVLKISGKEILLDALASMQENKVYFDPNILKQYKLIDDFTQKLKLTKREKEIMELVAKGKTSKEIANQLFVSELTIKTHRKNIHEKLGTNNVVNLLNNNSINYY